MLLNLIIAIYIFLKKNQDKLPPILERFKKGIDIYGYRDDNLLKTPHQKQLAHQYKPIHF